VNGILDFINKQNAIDEKSDTRASFAGDSSLQSVEYRLRNLMHEGFPVWDNEDSDEYRFVFLNQMGVEFEKNGQMTFKEDKFIKAMQKDFAGISQAITGEQGIAVQLKTVMQGYTRMPDGMIGIREQAFKNRINQIDQSIADKERRIEQRQQRLTEQFSRLQASLSNMQKQQQYLSSTLGGGGGNLVAQMLGG
jgi:flagellar hook-associated protein 2